MNLDLLCHIGWSQSTYLESNANLENAKDFISYAKKNNKKSEIIEIIVNRHKTNREVKKRKEKRGSLYKD